MGAGQARRADQDRSVRGSGGGRDEIRKSRQQPRENLSSSFEFELTAGYCRGLDGFGADSRGYYWHETIDRGRSGNNNVFGFLFSRSSGFFVNPKKGFTCRQHSLIHTT